MLPSIHLKSGDIHPHPGPTRNSYEQNIVIGHANVRSLTATVNDPNDPSQIVCKFDLVKNHILYYDYGIFGISETWLDGDVTTNLKIEGYHEPIRKDYNRSQRGIMVYVSQSISAKRREDLEPPGSEIIAVEIQSKFKKSLVCNCYRVQYYDIVDFCADIDTIVDHASHEFDDIIFLGDMNARNAIFWNQDRTNTEGRILYNTFNALGFEEMVHEPTRIVGETRSCIDLMFSNNPFIFSEISTHDKIVDICDHHPIHATLKYTLKKPKCYKRYVWDFKRGDYDKFRQLLLGANWKDCYVINNVNNTALNWLDLFISCAEQCIPHYEATIRPRDKSFMNSHIRTLMRKRDRFRQKYKQSNDERDGQKFRHYRNLVVSEIRKEKQSSEDKRSQKINDHNLNDKSWWSHLHEELGNSKSSAQGPLMHNGKIVTDGTEKANLLNDFFVDQSLLDTSNAQLPAIDPVSQYTMPQLVTQPEDIYAILSKLDPNKATGPDGVGNRLLKEAAISIAEPLSHLFNFCLSLGHFPESWKLAHVIPIFKKNDPLLCTNYRPISLLPCISKVFEKALFNHIFTFLKENKLIDKRQSGFIPGDSTINQLIAICNNLYKCTDIGNEMIGVFLDLTKAFDKVWHDGLLYKLQKIGVGGKIFDLLKSYLSNRKQLVTLPGCQSNVKQLHAGVPQGSVLGPLLFLIYINDIIREVECGSFLFADDTSLFQEIVKGNIIDTTAKINNNLSKISKWAKDWLVQINPSKTVVVLFSRKRSPTKLLPIYLGDQLLKSVQSHKHLGLIFSSDLTWTNHIDSLVSKANRRLGMAKRFKYKWSRKVLESCYFTFIRPILEYGCIIFDSCTQADAKKLESVQLEAARLCTGAKKCTSHEPLYSELGWMKLQERRYIAKLTKMYCIVNKLAPFYLYELIEEFKTLNNRSTRASNRGDFNIPRCKTVLYKNSFLIDALTLWNNTQIDVRHKPSLASLKRALQSKFEKSPNLFNHETNRHNQVAFMQLRLGFSNLNDHLFKKGCVTDRSCSCGFEREDTRHFMLHCNQYDTQRIVLQNKLSDFNVNLTIKLLLYGSDNLSEQQNMHIFNCVYDYIEQSKRF